MDNKKLEENNKKNNGVSPSLKHYYFLSYIYDKFSKKIFWLLRYVLVLIAIFFDKGKLFSFIGCPCLKNIILLIDNMANKLIGNQGNIIAITVVIWTFTMSVSIYCLGKLDYRYYGIRMSDILLSKHTPKTLLIIASTIMIEFLFLLLSGIFKLIYTSIFISVLQFLSMIYAVLMVYIETSRITVIERIKSLKINGEKLLMNVLKHANYFDDEDVDELLNLLTNHISFYLKEDKTKIYEFTLNIITGNSDIDERYVFIKNWITKVDNEENLDDLKKEIIKKEIFIAVIEKLSPTLVSYLLEIIDISNQKTFNEYIWCIACNIYFENFENQQWRKQLTKYLIINKMSQWSLEDDNYLILYLKEIYCQFNDNFNNFAMVFDYCIGI